jgi:hypothetical protein
MRLLLLALLSLAPALASAHTMKFKQQITVWDCPKDATYILMECSATEEEPVPVSVEMTEASPNFFVGIWDGVHTGNVPAYAMMSVSYDPESKFKLSGLAYVGWNEDYHLNPGLFFQEYATMFPLYYLTGPRLPQENGREWVVTLSIEEFSIEE